MNVFAIVDNIIEKAIDRLEGSQLVLDFTNAFSKKRKVARSTNKENQVQMEVPEMYEIPEDTGITAEAMQERKMLDLRRWFCMSRPQYGKSCGISSLTSCWNYLFSTLGHGSLPPLSQEKALVILGIDPPFTDIKFGSFTGNNTLIDWFNRLLMHFGLKGKAYISWKLHGKNRTIGIDSEQALKNLCDGLKGTKQAFIYHCYNHYMCPIGFEMTPMCPSDAYKLNENINPSELVPWIIIGEPSKTSPTFHVKKWSEISLDIDQQNPNYYNIRKPQLGIMTRQSETFKSGKKLGKNLHCLITFEKTE